MDMTATTPAAQPTVSSTTQDDLFVAQQRQFLFNDSVSQMLYNLCGTVVVLDGTTFRAPDADVAMALAKALKYMVIQERISVKEWLVGFVSTKKMCIQAMAETIINTERLSGGFFLADLGGDKKVEARTEQAEQACEMVENLSRDFDVIMRENIGLRKYVQEQSSCEKQRMRVQVLQKKKEEYLLRCEQEDMLQQQEDNRRFQQMIKHEQERVAQRDCALRQKRTAELQAIEQGIHCAETKESASKQKGVDALSGISSLCVEHAERQADDHREFLQELRGLMQKRVIDTTKGMPDKNLRSPSLACKNSGEESRKEPAKLIWGK